MNEVAVARHWPILNDNEAMVSGKVFKYLPGLRDTIGESKMPAEIPKIPKTHYFTLFLFPKQIYL